MIHHFGERKVAGINNDSVLCSPERVYLPCAVLQIPLPDFLLKALKSVAGCNTAMAMLIIGMILGSSSWRGGISREILAYLALRLLLLPGAVFSVCLLLRADPVTAALAVLLTGMPAGSTTAILAAQYRRDEAFASRLVLISTVISFITISAWHLVIRTVF